MPAAKGQYLTSRQIRTRLLNELEHNVAMRVQETERANEFIVSGRGELHLAIFIETMRREGYEFSVSRPEVIFKEDENGSVLEPIEQVFVEVSQDLSGRRAGDAWQAPCADADHSLRRRRHGLLHLPGAHARASWASACRS